MYFFPPPQWLYFRYMLHFTKQLLAGAPAYALPAGMLLCWEQSMLEVICINCSSLPEVLKGCYNWAFQGNTVGRELQCLHSQANDTCWKVLWKLILIMGEAVDYSGINLLTSAVVTQLRELNWKVGLSLHVWWKVVGSNSGEYMVAGQNQSGCSP